MAQGATHAQYQLPGVLGGVSEWAPVPDDAESCCGDTPFPSSCPSLQAQWGVVCDQELQLQPTSWPQQAQQPASQQSSDGAMNHLVKSSTATCDFDALDGSVLLDDAQSFDAYPGGVEAALADWQAAVSSRGAPVVSGMSAAAEAASSISIQQQHPGPQQQPYLPQWRPEPCPQLAADKQQQLQQWLQQLPCPPAQQPLSLGPAALSAQPRPHPQQLLQQQPLQCVVQQQQQQQQQQSCPFAAFKGDVVGAVLAGLMPAPSCDSNDEWMGPLCPGLPCC